MLCAGHTHRQPGSYRPSHRPGAGAATIAGTSPSQAGTHPANRTTTATSRRLERITVAGTINPTPDVAQPEEQRFRKPQVKGSSPFIGSNMD